MGGCTANVGVFVKATRLTLIQVMMLAEKRPCASSKAAQAKDKKRRVRERTFGNDQTDECEKQEVPDSKAKPPENASFGEDASEAEAAEQAGEKIGQIESRLYLPIRQ